MHRHYVPWPQDVVAEEKLASACVPGHMDECVAAVYDMRAEPGQAVDHAIDRTLVARDQRAGEHHSVATLELDHRVFAIRHTRQRRQRLALRSGGNDHDVLGCVVVDLPLVDQGIARNPEEAQITSDGHVAHHRAADIDHLALMGNRCIQGLLYTMHVRGEAGHDDALSAGSEHTLEGGSDVPLRCCEAGHLRIGRVDHEEVDTLLTETGEGTEIGDAAVQRQLVHLEVAGVQDQTGRRSVLRRPARQGSNGSRQRTRTRTCRQ